MSTPPRPVPQHWIAMIHGAHAAGNLVYSMDQTNLIRLAGAPDSELTEEGVCFALSMWNSTRTKQESWA